MHIPKNILVTGGGGYVGSVLVPKLLSAGYRVRVLDLFLYGKEVLTAHPNLEIIQGDLRNKELLETVIEGCDSVIHLACISNDPSFELNPALGKSINLDAFLPLVRLSKRAGVKRFIYASSSSVYGIKQERQVHEDLVLEPITDYSKYKAICEEQLLAEKEPGFTTLIVRPATVCGFSPRLRLDLTVNILTRDAVTKRLITIFGGSQKRPNIHIQDMADFYLHALKQPQEKIDGEVFNVGYENQTIQEIADLVKGVVGEDVECQITPTNDLRSYHISSKKVEEKLQFSPRHTIQDAVVELVKKFEEGAIPNAHNDKKYYNIQTMQSAQLV